MDMQANQSGKKKDQSNFFRKVRRKLFSVLKSSLRLSQGNRSPLTARAPRAQRIFRSQIKPSPFKVSESRRIFFDRNMAGKGKNKATQYQVPFRQCYLYIGDAQSDSVESNEDDDESDVAPTLGNQT